MHNIGSKRIQVIIVDEVSFTVQPPSNIQGLTCQGKVFGEYWYPLLESFVWPSQLSPSFIPPWLHLWENDQNVLTLLMHIYPKQTLRNNMRTIYIYIRVYVHACIHVYIINTLYFVSLCILNMCKNRWRLRVYYICVWCCASWPGIRPDNFRCQNMHRYVWYRIFVYFPNR